MTAPKQSLMPEVVLSSQPTDQPSLDLTSAGVQRYVWQGTYGPMLIEVRDGFAYVNGDRVESIHQFEAVHSGALRRTLG